MSDLNRQIIQGLTKFSWDLYKAVERNGENFVFSPHSVCSALMLACLGAKGNTERQILEAIGISGTASCDVHTVYSGVNDALKKTCSESEGVELNVANKLFASNVLSVLEKYAKESEKLYSSGTATTDFIGNPEESRKMINKWVEEQTKDKIKDLLSEGSIGSNTRLVLANAVYFKGKWDKPFKSEKTEQKDFHVSSSKTERVEMMQEKLDLYYVKDDKGKYAAVAVPYQDNLISMIIVRPDSIDGLSAVENSLTPEKISSLVKNLQQTMKCKVELGLPKFTFTETTDLTRILPKLGIQDLFDASKVDLTGMTDSTGVAISDVIHKAFIDVNEEGTEAAAATAMISRMMIMPMGEVQFVCDRPFLFLLTDNLSGLVLFIGRYRKP